MPRSTARARLRRPWLWMGIALLLMIFIVLDRSGWILVQRHDDIREYNGARVRINDVLNAHTLVIDRRDPVHDSPVTHVRLWGIDAPRLPRPGRDADPGAETAWRTSSDRVLHERVTLWLETHRTRDRLGRLLAHVELETGEMLSEYLLHRGLGQTNERWPHRWLEPYAHAEMRARQAGRGMWGDQWPPDSPSAQPN